MTRNKRRTFSADFKLDTVMEGLLGEKSITEICRERNIKDTLYYKWRDKFLENAASIFADGRTTAQNDTEDRIAELERKIGQLTVENDILKKAKRWLNTTYRTNGQ
jgi:transposase-like protein